MQALIIFFTNQRQSLASLVALMDDNAAIVDFKFGQRRPRPANALHKLAWASVFHICNWKQADKILME